MEWVEISCDGILAALPSDVKVRYDAWLVSSPDKVGRLETIVGNTLREFRDAIKSNPENGVDPRETYLPRSAVRHVESIVVFTLGMEMGLPLDSAGNSARVSADVFLRSIPYGRFKTTDDAAGEASPRFSVSSATGYAGRALPVVLALFLIVRPSFGGWIRPDSGPSDADVSTTFIPSSYAIATATLYGHLCGINAALAPLASTGYVDAAVEAVVISNAADGVARALAAAASATANSAITRSDAAYALAETAVPLQRSDSIDFVRIGDTNGVAGSISLGNASERNYWTFAVAGSNAWEVTTNGFSPLWTMARGTNRAIWRGGVGSVVFPAGDCLRGDGTNLFYVNAAGTITNNLTGNSP